MRAKPKLIRDPVHDTIAIPTDTEVGRLLFALIDTPEFQRLRRIRQLGLSFLVYPGAEHSRFSHSMGVAHLAIEMLERLRRHHPVTVDEQLVTVAASLLHDVGHGPFSHALEAVTGIHHEAYSRGIVEHPDSHVNAVLREVDPSMPARVAARLSGEHMGRAAPWLDEIVSSQLDADRLDYILRDGHATGVRIGTYDLARILALLEVADDGHLAVHVGAQEAVEGYLLARFHMYTQVYLHKSSRAAERMLEATLRRAAKLRRDGAGPAYWPHGALGKLIDGAVLDPGAFCQIDDMDVWVALKRWADDPDRVLAELSVGLTQRRLWKPLALPPLDARRAAELVSSARSVARVKGHVDPESAVLVDESKDSLYRPFTGVEGQSKSIRIVVRDGGTAFIEDRSEVVQLLRHLHVQQRLICVHPDLREAVGRVLPRV